MIRRILKGWFQEVLLVRDVCEVIVLDDIGLIIYTSMQINLPEEVAQLCINAPYTAFLSEVLFTQIYIV